MIRLSRPGRHRSAGICEEERLGDEATPEALDEKLRSEIGKWAMVIEAAGVSAN